MAGGLCAVRRGHQYTGLHGGRPDAHKSNEDAGVPLRATFQQCIPEKEGLHESSDRSRYTAAVDGVKIAKRHKGTVDCGAGGEVDEYMCYM